MIKVIIQLGTRPSHSNARWIEGRFKLGKPELRSTSWIKGNLDK